MNARKIMEASKDIRGLIQSLRNEMSDNAPVDGVYTSLSGGHIDSNDIYVLLDEAEEIFSRVQIKVM